MSDNTKIEWSDATWNPTRGCTKIAQGCKNCYAETFAERFRGVPGHPYEQGFDPRLAPEQLTIPLKWKKPRRIFVDSMSDLFHEAFPDEHIAAVFGVMALTPWHTYQVLTKRPERAAALFARMWSENVMISWLRCTATDWITTTARDVLFARPWADVLNRASAALAERGFDGEGFVPEWPLPNVWIGTSIAEQKDADKNIPYLLQIPAAVRFLSVEPIIGPVDLRHTKHIERVTFDEHGCWANDVPVEIDALTGSWVVADGADTGKGSAVQWVIVGGESGHGARPCNVEWISSIVQQCKDAGVPAFVKQLGAKPFVRCGNCGKGIGRHVGGGFVDACGPTHAVLIGEMTRIRSVKGGDWNEWSEDLRVRQFPEVA